MGSSRAVLVRADARPLVLSAALPDALDPLPHPQRMRELALCARRLTAQPPPSRSTRSPT
ncbi:hypothetical protein DKT74_37750 [Streptomyces sp. ZEA17I]|nr:hypothetical protein DKT74_37750 [Streptomyces sp. ZEA17I]